jgi:hypothetical protein
MEQTDSDFTLTISDNSTDDRVKHMMEQEFPEVRYIRRHPGLAAMDHFNVCISEVAAPYFCLFHDDDLLLSDFVEHIKAAIQRFPDAAAIGCNAHIEIRGQLNSRPSFLSAQAYEVIRKPLELATRYFARYQSGIAPFPGYVYQRASIGSLRFNASEGKYSDVTWLLRLTEKAPLVWISRPLMTYRIHGDNDGLVESRRDRLRFLAYLKQHHEQMTDALISDYRCAFVYKPLARSPTEVSVKRRDLALRFLRHYAWRRYLRLSTYKAALHRALVKQQRRP